MQLERNLENLIGEEAQKLITRYELYAKHLAEEMERRGRRTTSPVPKPIVQRPEYWIASPGFDPFKVRARLPSVVHSVARSLLSGTYRPRPPALYEVDKSPPEKRGISVFQVADNAVSKMVYKSVLRKNRPLLSARSYAYRDDVGAVHAVQYMTREMRGQQRLFVAEYDFRKYFDAISHAHLLQLMDDPTIIMTALERHVLMAFLQSTPPSPIAVYDERSTERRDVGVPQGTSVSLLLANMAAMPLDRSLEQLGVGFVRFADDTVIWSHDYGRICEAANVIREASAAIGPAINLEKSDGISLLMYRGELANAEMKAKDNVAFVGHRIHRDKVSLGVKVSKAVHRRVTSLLRDNLLRALQDGSQDLSRVSSTTDRDYVVYVLQLRRYLYGDLSESQLRRYLRGGIPPRRFKGLMSFFPLIDDHDQLMQLDAWIVNQTWMALRRRAILLASLGVTTLPAPHGLSPNELSRHLHPGSTGPIDLRLPSLRRMSALVHKVSARFGPTAVRSGPSPYDY